MSHQDIMCDGDVEISNIVEVVDVDEQFGEIDSIGGVPYDHYEVGVGDDHYEEVTCETEDSQGLMMQHLDDDGTVDIY